MKRLRRMLFNTLTAISLLLATAAAGLWVTSGFAIDDYSFTYGTVTPSNDVHVRVLSASSAQGALQVERLNVVWQATTPEASQLLASAPGPHFTFDSTSYSGLSIVDRLVLRGGKFDWASATQGKVTGCQIEFPYWPVLILALVLPAFRLYQRIRRQTGRAGLCPTCGYDIRANTARCSECGHESASSEAPR